MSEMDMDNGPDPNDLESGLNYLRGETGIDWGERIIVGRDDYQDSPNFRNIAFNTLEDAGRYVAGGGFLPVVYFLYDEEEDTWYVILDY